MKSLFALVAWLFVTLSATAQIRKDPTNWSAKVDKQPAKVGDVVSVRIQASIVDGWHIYSNDLDPDLGPIPTTFKFSKSDAYALVGKPVQLALKKYSKKYGELKSGNFRKGPICSKDKNP